MTIIDNELLLKIINHTKLNYSEISRMTDISRATFYNILFGRTQPSIYAMNNLAGSLNINQNDFLSIFFPDIKFKKEF